MAAAAADIIMAAAAAKVGGGGRGGGSGSMKRCTLCGGMFQDVAEHVSSKIHRDALRRSYEANGWEAEFIEEMMAP